MADSRYVDGVLKEWGDRLYYGKLKGKKGSQSGGGGAGGAGGKQGRAGAGVAAAAIREAVSRTVRKTPEVMVKISGGGKCRSSIKAHINYISRDGELALEDQDGKMITGKAELKEIDAEWASFANRAPGEKAIPATGGYRKEAVNIILSMPPGTDRESVRGAAKDFAKEAFAKHRYVFVAHTDEKHPHVHVCVRSVDRDGKRLNPRKADIQKWREGFAEKLRDHGIEANATRRMARGRVRKGEKQAVRHIDRENRESPSTRPQGARTTQARVAAVRDEVRGVVPPRQHPAETKLQATRQEVVRAYGAMATALAASEVPGDRQLAVAIVEHVKAMDPAKSSHTVAVERAKRSEGVEHDSARHDSVSRRGDDGKSR